MYELRRKYIADKVNGEVQSKCDNVTYLWDTIEVFIRATKKENFVGYVSVRENGKLVLFMKMDPNDCIRAVGRTDQWRDWVEQLAPMFYG